MYVKSVHLEDFKVYRDRNFVFEKKRNVLRGPNGKGKTSVMEGIVWALYGKTPWGNAQTSHYIRHGQSAMRVTVELENHTITRKEHIKWGTTLELDGVETSQRRLEKHLPTFEIFMGSFWVGYISNLSEAERKQFLLNLLPPIDRKSLLHLLVDESTMADYIVNLSEIEREYKNYTKLVREQDKEVNEWLEGIKEIKTKLDMLPSKTNSCKACGSVFSRTQVPIVDERRRLMKNELIQMHSGMDAASDKLQVLQNIKEALSPKGIPTLELQEQMDTLLSYLPKEIGIQTEQPLKTKEGEMKDVFKFVLNDTPYEWCSAGEKIRIDMVLADLVDNLTGGQIGMRYIEKSNLLSYDVDEGDAQLFLEVVENKGT